MTIENLAIAIIQKLRASGYLAYFAGGFVRDYLLGISSFDIDIATNASPKTIQSIFPKTIAVGAAFGVIIVVMEGKNFEVSTFRKDLEYQDGRHPIGVEFSSPEEDAKRRDFTINGMFFDPLNDTILDYVGGKEDLEKKLIRTIGSAEDRFTEDRLRMLRAVRFAHRLGFDIEKKTVLAIKHHAEQLIPAVSIERIWQEFCKMSAAPHFKAALYDLFQLGLIQVVFPHLKKYNELQFQKIIEPFDNYPVNCPTIIFILEFFKSYTLNECLELARYLKLTNYESKLIEFYYKSIELFHTDATDLVAWAHYYAHAYAELMLEVETAKLPQPMSIEFLHFHEQRQKQLFHHIQRIQKKQPLITSEHLSHLGIQPGKRMGELLKQAERIAIEHDLHDPDAVLKHFVF